MGLPCVVLALLPRVPSAFAAWWRACVLGQSTCPQCWCSSVASGPRAWGLKPRRQRHRSTHLGMSFVIACRAHPLSLACLAVSWPTVASDGDLLPTGHCSMSCGFRSFCWEAQGLGSARSSLATPLPVCPSGLLSPAPFTPAWPWPPSQRCYSVWCWCPGTCCSLRCSHWRAIAVHGPHQWSAGRGPQNRAELLLLSGDAVGTAALEGSPLALWRVSEVLQVSVTWLTCSL